MSKKDYVIIAEGLNAYSFANTQERLDAANLFADVLRYTNHRFSRDRFIDAVMENKYWNTAGHAINQ